MSLKQSDNVCCTGLIATVCKCSGGLFLEDCPIHENQWRGFTGGRQYGNVYKIGRSFNQSPLPLLAMFMLCCQNSRRFEGLLYCRGIWNVPYIASVYLIHGHRMSLLDEAYADDDLDADMAFCRHLRALVSGSEQSSSSSSSTMGSAPVDVRHQNSSSSFCPSLLGSAPGVTPCPSR